MGAMTDWVLTLRQTLPRVGTVLRNLRPTLHLPDLRAIDGALLAEHGIRGIIWDIDGTVMPNHAGTVHPEFAAAFDALLSHPQLRHVILSNSGERRFAELGTIFPAIPILRAYKTKDGPRFRRLLDGVDHWSGAEGEVSGAQVLKKPEAVLIELALRELGLDDPQSVLMVGDQYFTDIAGANLGGVRSAKVDTLARETFTLPIRLFQRTEAILYRMLHGAPQRRSPYRPRP